jgi:preprotein translocase subunit SecG
LKSPFKGSLMFIAEFQQYFFGFSIFITSLFLVLLVLVQRGRGGGLTGALGGAGGQSAFGTKAGDLFTRITVGVAAVWIFLCAASVFFLRDRALPQTGVADRDLPAMTGPQDPAAGGSADGGLQDAGLNVPLEGTAAPAAAAPAETAQAETAVEPAAGAVPPAETPAVPSAETPATPAAEVSDPSELGQAAEPTVTPAEPGKPN